MWIATHLGHIRQAAKVVTNNPGLLAQPLHRVCNDDQTCIVLEKDKGHVSS